MKFFEHKHLNKKRGNSVFRKVLETCQNVGSLQEEFLDPRQGNFLLVVPSMTVIEGQKPHRIIGLKLFTVNRLSLPDQCNWLEDGLQDKNMVKWSQEFLRGWKTNFVITQVRDRGKLYQNLFLKNGQIEQNTFKRNCFRDP